MPPRPKLMFGKKVGSNAPPVAAPPAVVKSVSFEDCLAEHYQATSVPIDGVNETICNRLWFKSSADVDELRGGCSDQRHQVSPTGLSDTIVSSATSTPCTSTHVSPVTVVCKKFDFGKSNQRAPVCNLTTNDSCETNAASNAEDLGMFPQTSTFCGTTTSTSSTATTTMTTSPTPNASTTANNNSSPQLDIVKRKLYRDTMPLCLCIGHPHILEMIGLWHDEPKSFLLLEDLYYQAIPIASKSSSSSDLVPPTHTFRSTLEHFLEDIGVTPSPCPTTTSISDDIDYDGGGVGCDPLTRCKWERQERCKLRRRVLLAQTVAYSLLHSLVALEACGIRHRDIKPDNVCLHHSDPTDPNSPLVVKLIDFGESYIKRNGIAASSISAGQGSVGGVGDTSGKITSAAGMKLDHRDLQAVGVVMDYIIAGGVKEDLVNLCEPDTSREVRRRVRDFAVDIACEDGDIGQLSHPKEYSKYVPDGEGASETLHTILTKATSSSSTTPSSHLWLRRYRAVIALSDLLAYMMDSKEDKADCCSFYSAIRTRIGETTNPNAVHGGVVPFDPVADDSWYYSYYREATGLSMCAADLLQHPLFDEFGPFRPPTEQLIDLLHRWELVGFDLEADHVLNAWFAHSHQPSCRDTLASRVHRGKLYKRLVTYGAHLQWSSTHTQLDRVSNIVGADGRTSNNADSAPSGYNVSPPLSTTQLVRPLVTYFTDHPSCMLSLLLQESRERDHD